MRSNGRAFHPIHLSAKLERFARNSLRAFANQNAPIKVQPFRGLLCIHHIDF
jgi:hypothetical protein